MMEYATNSSLHATNRRTILGYRCNRRSLHRPAVDELSRFCLAIAPTELVRRLPGECAFLTKRLYLHLALPVAIPMSRLRKYPGDSEQPSSDPFSDKEGRNPFSDRDEVPAEVIGPTADTNLYQGGAGGLPAHVVGGFVATLPHRGSTVLTLGILGIIGAAIFAFCWPMLTINLFVTLPAWLMGQSDLRAMQAGAMNREGRGMTLAGFWLGVAGTAGTAILFVVMAWYSFKMSGLF
jgi:hypothetical protein